LFSSCDNIDGSCVNLFKEFVGFSVSGKIDGTNVGGLFVGGNVTLICGELAGNLVGVSGNDMDGNFVGDFVVGSELKGLEEGADEGLRSGTGANVRVGGVKAIG
jgi:hypothetical protein